MRRAEQNHPPNNILFLNYRNNRQRLIAIKVFQPGISPGAQFINIHGMTYRCNSRDKTFSVFRIQVPVTISLNKSAFLFVKNKGDYLFKRKYIFGPVGYKIKRFSQGFLFTDLAGYIINGFHFLVRFFKLPRLFFYCLFKIVRIISESLFDLQFLFSTL